MRRPLLLKILGLLLLVTILSLSSTLIFRSLIIDDFRSFREGELEDRVYWVTARLEGAYADSGGWDAARIADHVAWALPMGLEIRLKDRNGRLVTDTDRAIALLSGTTRERLLAVSGYDRSRAVGSYIPYPLFSGGEEIGRLDVRFLPPLRTELFERRAASFLLWSSLFMGMLAVILGMIAARRLAVPLTRLAKAANDIGRGKLESRVPANDRDEIGRLGHAFNRMAEQLKLQDSLRRTLFANAAHELRTPLAAMRCEIEGMMDGVIPVSGAQLQSLNDEIARLSGFLQGMEDLSLAEASSLSLNLQQVTLSQFLGGISDRYLPLFREKGVALDIECDPGEAVTADPERLSQMLVNLIANALKATPPGGRVAVRTGKNRGEFALVVEDTGCGIAEEEIPRIFERFYRGPGGGTGIGLAIVKELVEAHGWRIEVDSEIGRGSRFVVVTGSHLVRKAE